MRVCERKDFWGATVWKNVNLKILFHQWEMFNICWRLTLTELVRWRVGFISIFFSFFLILSAPFPERDYGYFMTCKVCGMCGWLFKEKHINTFQETLSRFWTNRTGKNVGHQSWKRHEERGRKKTAAKIEVRNAKRAQGKRARKFSQWTLITLEEKDLKNYFYFWRVHTFV